MPRQSMSKCRHFGSRLSLTGHGSRAGCEVKSRTRWFCKSHVYLFLWGRLRKQFENLPARCLVRVMQQLNKLTPVRENARLSQSPFLWESSGAENISDSRLRRLCPTSSLKKTTWGKSRRMPVLEEARTMDYVTNHNMITMAMSIFKALNMAAECGGMQG